MTFKSTSINIGLCWLNKRFSRKIIEQHNGLDWDSIQRLGELRSIKEYVERNGDPCNEIKNIKAIVAAYKSGALKFDGSATYWCQGKMLAKAAGFDITHVQELNTDKNRGDGGFWAEGVRFRSYSFTRVQVNDTSARSPEIYPKRGKVKHGDQPSLVQAVHQSST